MDPILTYTLGVALHEERVKQATRRRWHADHLAPTPTVRAGLASALIVLATRLAPMAPSVTAPRRPA